jgi:tetratricopeptide (TPR) repeat protein
LLISLAFPAAAEEAYPGQNNLAAGLTCYRNLDYDCALARLETALSEFSPEKDDHYLQHVSEARLVLAMIHVARDNLDKAEQEFKTLLVLIPDYALPKGDHPPKVRYIFDRAKKSVEKKPIKKPPKPPKKVVPVPAPVPVPEVEHPWSLSAAARFVALFGDDADQASSGPGAALAVGFATSDWLTLQVAFAYSHHSAVEEDTALQTVLAMGTQDRYDHWGFTLQATTAVAWPASGSWALVLGLHPSVLVTAGGSSFFLPAGLSGEIRW